MVHFVGAGCGAVDLITVRGMKLIESADVIIYAGSLVNPELLNFAKPDCEIYDSSKMNLEQIINTIEIAEKSGKNTVRLQTGDTSLYSAMREQADRLSELNIEFDVCPGVSSFCGVAGALKTEYTLPDVSQTVIITRIAGRTPVPELESIEKLSSHRATMVIFLSAEMTEILSKKLISGGYTPDTPCAIVYKASWADEKIVYCTVGSLADSARKNNINKTALIVVGDFLGDRYSLSKLYDAEFETEFRKADKN